MLLGRYKDRIVQILVELEWKWRWDAPSVWAGENITMAVARRQWEEEYVKPNYRSLEDERT